MKNSDPFFFIDNPNPMLIFDKRTMQILDVNKASVEKYGYDRDEFRQMKINELRFKGDNHKIEHLFEKYPQTTAKPGIWRHIDKKGQLIYVKISARQIEYHNRTAFWESIVDVSNTVKAEQELRYHFNNSPLALIEWDSHFQITGWSKKSEELLGWRAGEVLGKMPFEFQFIQNQSLVQITQLIKKAINGKEYHTIFEVELYRKDGTPIVTEWLTTIEYDKNKKLISALTRIQDLTEKKESERIINLLTNAVIAAKNGILIADFKGKIEWVNPAFTQLTGYASDDVIGRTPAILKSGKQDKKFYTDLWNTVLSGHVWHGILINRRKDASTYHEEQTITPLQNEKGEISHFIAIKQDITKRVEAEEKIYQSLKEKEILLSEIHHRVKNNLAIISSLLEAQLLNIDNDTLHKILYDSMMRIKSIAIIHEQLYNYPELSSINFIDYIRKLTGTIQRTINSNNKNIQMVIKGDHVMMDINAAIPCGLIVNELVTNSFKHAFKNQKNGEIAITISHENGFYLLKISDDGIGISDQSNSVKSKSLGMVIVKTLAKQLKAEMHTKSENGTTFLFIFPDLRDLKSNTKAFS